MRAAREEEPRAGWEGPRGAEAPQASPARRLRPQPPAPTRGDPLRPGSLPPSPPGAGGGPEADIVQSRERTAQRPAPGTRRANGGERGGTRGVCLPSDSPASPASRRAAGVRGCSCSQPSPGGSAFPVSLRQVATRSARELRIHGAAGPGGAVRQKESPPFESSALLALPGLGRRAGLAARPPVRPHYLQGSPEPMGLDCVPDWLCDLGKAIRTFPGSQVPLQYQRVWAKV